MWNCDIPQQRWQQALALALEATQRPAVTVAEHRSRPYQHAEGLGYGSGIALALAAQRPQPAAQIAAQLATALAGSEFQATAQASGHLLATWQPAAIAPWLEQLTNQLTVTPARPTATVPDSLLPVQYTGARCTAWLQLADREQWLPGAWCPETGLWHWAEPQPWPTAALSSWQATDWALLATLVAVADAQLQPSPAWPRYGQQLSAAVLQWQSQRPLVGLGRSHWGLLAVVQRVLAWLLRDACGVVSPFEL